LREREGERVYLSGTAADNCCRWWRCFGKGGVAFLFMREGARGERDAAQVNPLAIKVLVIDVFKFSRENIN